VIIPAKLKAACKGPKHELWLSELPDAIDRLQRRWSFAIGTVFENASAAWVARVTLPGGTKAVLKLGMRHSECEHEMEGLRFWSGQTMVQLLDADRELGAMLLEACEPGDGLWMQPKPTQDVVLAGILKRLRRAPADQNVFRDLSEMLTRWNARTRGDASRWTDAGLVEQGLQLLVALAATETPKVLLATDLHAGNVLQAHREPWLAIDPRPYIGDPAYDATQHILNRAKAHAEPIETIRRFAEIAELDPERVRLWTFARAAAQPRDDWNDASLSELARAIGV
jgi:streptomycin 6-kinase